MLHVNCISIKLGKKTQIYLCIYIYTHTHIFLFSPFYTPRDSSIHRMHCTCFFHLEISPHHYMGSTLILFSWLPRILLYGQTRGVLPLFSRSWNRETISLLCDVTDDKGGAWQGLWGTGKLPCIEVGWLLVPAECGQVGGQQAQYHQTFRVWVFFLFPKRNQKLVFFLKQSLPAFKWWQKSHLLL